MIEHFDKEYKFLSNFYPVEVDLDEITYPTVEHAYQASKTLDKEARNTVLLCKTPNEAKRVGKSLVLRENWNDVRVAIMRDLIRQKFINYEALGKLLLDTGDEYLLEGNVWHDNFWGACQCSRCADRPQKNKLGVILMGVRKELRGEGRADETYAVDLY